MSRVLRSYVVVCRLGVCCAAQPRSRWCGHGESTPALPGLCTTGELQGYVAYYAVASNDSLVVDDLTCMRRGMLTPVMQKQASLAFLEPLD